MDIFKFQDYLFDTLEHNYSNEEMNIAHDTVCQLTRHSTNASKTAILLVRTAYAVMISAKSVEGIEQFCNIMEQEADTLRKATNYTNMKSRTREIEQANQE